jgi:hypothetical protein
MVTPADDAFDAGRLVCAALDDTMTGFGFASGQIGSKPGEAGVVFCSGHRAFRARFPSLAPDIGYPDACACTDLNVYVTFDDGGPHLADVHLDGFHLGALVGDVRGDDLWPDVTALARSPWPEALDLLDQILQEIFRRAATDGGAGHE